MAILKLVEEKDVQIVDINELEDRFVDDDCGVAFVKEDEELQILTYGDRSTFNIVELKGGEICLSESVNQKNFSKMVNYMIDKGYQVYGYETFVDLIEINKMI